MDAALNEPRQPFSPRGLPLLGHLPFFYADKLGFLTRCAASGAAVVKLNIGSTTFLLNDAEDIRHVLETQHQNYDKGPRITGPKGRDNYGQGLMTSLGEDHLRERRMMQPVFLPRAVAPFAYPIVRLTEEKIAKWETGQELNIAAEMTDLAQRAMMEILFGREAAGDDELRRAILTRKRYIQHLFDFGPFAPDRLPFAIVREHRRAIRVLEGAVADGLRKRRASGHPADDMISLLMRASYRDGSTMSDDRIRDEVVMLSVTGYETVGEALSWTCYLLSLHPWAEEKLRAEVRDVLGERVPVGEDVPNLRYTDMVFSESLRLYPPTWIFIRAARHADTLPSGAVIPAGAKLYLCPYVVHRNPRYFPDPGRFDPERFTESARKDRARLAYFPFGAGPRVCIGQQLAKIECVLVLAAIARKFRMTLVPGQKIVPQPAITLRSKNGIRVRLERRDG